MGKKLELGPRLMPRQEEIVNVFLNWMKYIFVINIQTRCPIFRKSCLLVQCLVIGNKSFRQVSLIRFQIFLLFHFFILLSHNFFNVNIVSESLLEFVVKNH